MSKPKYIIPPEVERVSIWLRFENKGPATAPEIKAATGIQLNPLLIRKADELGLFRLAGWGGFF